MSLLLLKSWFQDQPSSTLTQITRSQSGLPAAQDDFSRLERRVLELQHELQTLLDVQAERLTAASSEDGGSDVSSSRDRVIPVRQPPRPRISLRAARRGIGNAMRELSMTTAEQRDLLSVIASAQDTSLKQLDQLEKKQNALHAQTDALQNSEVGSRLEALRREDQSLQADINAAQLHLSELKSKQRAVRLECSTLTNLQESKLSSYRESLKLVDAQIKHLAQDNEEDLSKSRRNHKYGSTGVVTVENARDYLQQSLASLEQRRAETELECQVLDEGGAIWDDVIAQVQSLERFVAGTVQGTHSVLMTNDDDISSFKPGHLISRIDRAITTLTRYFDQARSQGWNLLLCCIGAELEALSHARDFLEPGKAAAATPVSDNGATKIANNIEDEPTEEGHDIISSRVSETNRDSLRSSISRRPRLALSDDDPDPDLLFSKPDNDDD